MMTSKELKQRSKEVKKLEDIIKTLTATRKQMMNLHKLDYDSYELITKEFNDDLWYKIEDQIKLLQAKIANM